MANPCLDCGACCAFFRASFYWAEGADVTPGGVPVALTEPLGHHRRVMRGTDRAEPHCAALKGVIGIGVFCSIYENRPSVCRDFAPSWENGVHSEGCDAARAAKGLPPLTPEIHETPEDLPRVA